MADTVSMALAELVRKAEQNGDVDFLREGVRVVSQALMEVEVSQHLAEAASRWIGSSRTANSYICPGCYIGSYIRQENALPNSIWKGIFYLVGPRGFESPTT